MPKKLLLILAGALVAGLIPAAAVTREAPSMSFSSKSIKGTWTWALEGRLVRYQYAQLGLATFDGNGKCTILLRENSGANGGYVHNSSACDYEVGKDGMGRIDYSLDGEAGAAMIAVGPNEIRMSSPDPGNPADGVLKPAKPMVADKLIGRYTFSMDGTIATEKLGASGIMTFDGRGKCTQTMAYNYGTGLQEVTTDACTYTVDEDGIGDADITYSNGTGGDSYFLMANGGKEIFLLTKAEAEVLYGSGFKS